MSSLSIVWAAGSHCLTSCGKPVGRKNGPTRYAGWARRILLADLGSSIGKGMMSHRFCLLVEVEARRARWGPGRNPIRAALRIGLDAIEAKQSPNTRVAPAARGAAIVASAWVT